MANCWLVDGSNNGKLRMGTTLQEAKKRAAAHWVRDLFYDRLRSLGSPMDDPLFLPQRELSQVVVWLASFLALPPVLLGADSVFCVSTRILVSTKKSWTTGALDPSCPRTKLSSETFSKALRDNPAVDGQIGHTHERRVSASIIEKWYLPDVAVAPFQHQKPRTMSQTSQWQAESWSSFHVFGSPGKSDSEEKDVRDDVYVHVVEMGPCRRMKRWKSEPRTDLGQKGTVTPWAQRTTATWTRRGDAVARVVR